MPKSTTTSNFKESVDVLKQLIPIDITKHSQDEATKVFLASLELLCAIKQDRELLRNKTRSRANKNDESIANDGNELPSYDEIPAISAVLNDRCLFEALVTCLQTSVPTETEVNVHHATIGRKRSLSVAGDSGANKIMKLNISPVPSQRKASMSFVDVTSRVHGNTRKPSFDLPVVAATALYTAFQHLDHWPVQLVKAYAEDCFGPRLWVDNKQCSALVQNLALTHLETSDEGEKIPDQVLADANVVAEAYNELTDEHLSDKQSLSEQARRESSGKAAAATAEKPSKPKLNHQASSMSSVQLESDSDSGKEEEDIKTTVSDLSNSSGQKGKVKDPLSETGKSRSRKRKAREEANSTSPKNGNRTLSRSNAKSPILTNGTSERNNSEMKVEHAAKDSTLYPLQQKDLNLMTVRQRYFGTNLQQARASIAASLADRLDVKSKQNSGLLHCLPSFTSVPAVRSQIAANLEKWLQSPALAGLARTLFASTVRQMTNTDPPLEEDLQAIDSILSMKLKANQFNAHIENVTSIARRIPVASVAHHMYSKLVSDAFSKNDEASGNANELKMIAAIHREIPGHLSYDGIASAILAKLANPVSQEASSTSIGRNDYSVLRKLRSLLQALSSHLGSSLDGCNLVEAFMSLDVDAKTWSVADEENKARIMFSCVTLSVSQSSVDTKSSKNEVDQLVKFLNRARKMFLSWCCTEYGPRFHSEDKSYDETGAGPPNFSSVLGPRNNQAKTPNWLKTMRCLLFMEDVESNRLKRFLFPGVLSAQDEAQWEQEKDRIKVCCRYGGNLDDELIGIVLKPSSDSHGRMDSEMTIRLLEELLDGCRGEDSRKLHVSDPDLVWELYNFVQFTPSKVLSISQQSPNGSGSEAERDSVENLPRLAFPGLWWRVTIIALVMCAYSPDKIGNVVWKEHPTLRSLIKMVTSNRYRFPTVDCDETERTTIKEAEQAARDQETRAAEYLFLPPKRIQKKKEQKGSRASRRLLRQQREKEEAQELEELNRRKRLLRIAQKSIMLWDPDGPARKPPRESVDLLLAVEEAFDLSNIFQRSNDPDFLMLTIGQTTRGAIERAYDWLIPIISRIPDTISRLPSSASCFLLLRAYGTEGDERKQLKELSAPLLHHVKDSLSGKFGESDASKAFDLLMTDVASQKPDRRRCARRVLHDSIVTKGTTKSHQNWMINVLSLDHSRSLVADAVKHLSTAAGLERGKVLCSILLALEEHVSFAKSNEITLDVNFSDLLVKFMSGRPSVYAETLDAHDDVRTLATRVLSDEFSRYLLSTNSNEDVVKPDFQMVAVDLYETNVSKSTTVHFPLSFLQSISVLLSIWQKSDRDECNDETVKKVEIIADALLLKDVDYKQDHCKGLASARFVESNDRAVFVESWITLSKAKNDSLARRAALSAPLGFLSRLLLCSGLPKASLVTMIDKLGRMGSASDDMESLYDDLLAPSASSEWDLGRIGHRRELRSKLLGRLKAYMRLNKINQNEDNKVDLTFLNWLIDKSKENDGRTNKRTRQKKLKTAESKKLIELKTASSLTSNLWNLSVDDFNDMESANNTEPRLESFKQLKALSSPNLNEADDFSGIMDLVVSCTSNEHFFILEDRIEKYVNQNQTFKDGSGAQWIELAIKMWKGFEGLEIHHGAIAQSVLLKWVPRLTRYQGSPELWDLIFSQKSGGLGSVFMSEMLFRCLESWESEPLSACRDWILSTGSILHQYDSVLMTVFLTSTSEQLSTRLEPFCYISLEPSFGWGDTKDFVIAAAKIALSSLKFSASDKLVDHPVGYDLAFLLGKRGKNQLRCVCEGVLQELESECNNDKHRALLEILLLRLYLCFPFWMDLGSEALRISLMQGSEKYADRWVTWNSTYDDKIDDMLSGLRSGEIKMARQLSEFSRKQPLLMLRKLPIFCRILEIDATVDFGQNSDQQKDSIGQNLQGKREVKFEGKLISLSVLHWGYSFTEPLWMATLETMSSMPREVLFQCGLKAGLLDLFNVYLKLMSVFLQLLGANKADRLKTKLKEMFSAFRQSSPSGWNQWLNMKVDESEVRHLLMSCDFISPQEAIDSLKQKMQY